MTNKHFPYYSSLEHLAYKVTLYKEQQVIMQDYLLDRITQCAKLAACRPYNVRDTVQRKYLLDLYNQIK